MVYDLETLHWREFEKLIAFYLKSVIGEGVTLFDGSPDQGRDAIFNGRANSFPSSTDPHQRHWIFQVKHRTLRSATLSNIEQKLQKSLLTELKKILVAPHDNVVGRFKPNQPGTALKTESPKARKGS